jgi:hypothetical protein
MSSIKLITTPSLAKEIIRMISSIAFAISLLFLVVWLLRSVLSLESIANDLILASIGFYALSTLLTIETEDMFIAISSIINKAGNIALFSAIVFFIFSFFGLQKIFTDLILPLFIAAIILKLASWSFITITSRRDKYQLDKHVKEIGPYSVDAKQWLLSSNESSKIVLVRRGRRKVGFVNFNSMNLEFKNDLGNINLKLNAPLLVYSPYLKLKAKNIHDSTTLINDAQKLLNSILSSIPFRKREYVKLPFISVESDEFGERVKVGPIYVAEELGREEVRIGPWIRISSVSKHKGIMYLFSANPKYSIKLSIEEMIIITNSDKFIINPTSIKVEYLGYDIEMSKNELNVQAPDFKLKVRDNKILFISGKRSYSISNSKLAEDLINAAKIKIYEQINSLEKILYFDPVYIITALKDVIEMYGEML